MQYLADAAGNLDEARLAEVVEMTRAAGAWAVPTMALWEVLRGTIPRETVLSYPETKYMPPAMVEQWTARVDRALGDPAFDAAAARG